MHALPGELVYEWAEDIKKVLRRSKVRVLWGCILHISPMRWPASPIHAGGLQWLQREGDIRFKGIKADTKHTKTHISSCAQAIKHNDRRHQ